MVVVMNPSGQLRIDVDAAKALADWKSLFAAEVSEGAKRIAAASSHPDSVTLADYRMAASIALQSLSAAIHAEHEPQFQHKAA
jgi:hypothetical protein